MVMIHSELLRPTDTDDEDAVERADAVDANDGNVDYDADDAVG